MDTQTAVEQSNTVEYLPISSLRNNAPIEFNIPALSEEYFDLQNTKLYVKCKIVSRDGADLAPDVVVAPVNDLFNSMFSNIEFYMNDQLVSHSNNNHGYTSMIDHLIHDSVESVASERSMRLIYKDTASQLDCTEARKSNHTHRKPGDIVEDNAGNFNTLPAGAVTGNHGL